MIICVARVVFSFLPDLTDTSPIFGALSNLAYMLTEPVFATVRRAMPRVGDLPIDFSPIVVFLGLNLLLMIVRSFPG